ncbi:MAG: M28 family peptidase [Planctomycetes bacterium]|nr:M28 family peptidase [Planctomycetota bacterium]
MRKVGSWLAILFALAMISTVTIFKPEDITRNILLKIIPERKIPQSENVIARVTFDAPVVPGQTTLDVQGVMDNAGNGIKPVKKMAVQVQTELAVPPGALGGWAGAAEDGSEQVIVIFDHAMVKSEAEKPSHYAVGAPSGAVPTKAVYDPATYETTLTFPKGTFKPGEECTVSVSGVSDVAGTQIPKDASCKVKFEGKLKIAELQSAAQDLQDDPEGKAVLLKFNAVLDPASAERASAYTDEKGKPAVSATLQAGGANVLVTFEHTMIPGESTISAPNLKGAKGGSQWTRRVASVAVKPGAKGAPKIVKVEAQTEPDAKNDVILITCNRAMLAEDACNIENYTIESPEGTTLDLSGAKAAIDEPQEEDKGKAEEDKKATEAEVEAKRRKAIRRIRLTLGDDNLKTGDTFNIQISKSLRDVSANAIAGKLKWSGKVVGDTDPPKVREIRQNLFVDPIGSTIDVKFDEAVQAETAEVKESYKTSDGQTPYLVKIGSDGKTVQAAFVEPVIPGETKLSVTAIQDLAGNTLKKAEGLEIVGDDQKPPKIIRCVAKAYPGWRNDVIRVGFSEGVIREDAEQLGNYIFRLEKPDKSEGQEKYDTLDLSGCLIRYNPARRTAVIRLDRKDNPVNLPVRRRFLVSARNIRDLSGNRIAEEEQKKGEVEGDTAPPGIARAVWDPKSDPDRKTLYLLFREPVDARSIGDVSKVSVKGAGKLRPVSVEALPDGVGAKVQLSGPAHLPSAIPSTWIIVAVILVGLYGLIVLGRFAQPLRSILRLAGAAAAVLIIVGLLHIGAGQTRIVIEDVCDLAGNVGTSATSPPIEKAERVPPRIARASVFQPEGFLTFQATVQFSQPVLPGPAQDPANFAIEAPVGKKLTPDPMHIIYDPITQTTTLRLKDADLKGRDRFKISAANVPNLYGDTIAAGAAVSGAVRGDTTPPKIISATQNLKITSVALKDEIEEARNIKGFPTGGSMVIDIKFSEPIDKDTANNDGNYRCLQGQAPKISVLRRDRKTVRLVVKNSPAVIPGETQLLVRNIKDLAGNKMATVPKLDIQQQRQFREPPTIIGVRANAVPGIANDTVIVSFSKKLISATATDKANYAVESPLGTALSLDHASVSYNDPSATVTLTFNGKGDDALNLREGDKFKVSVSNVADVAGNKIKPASGQGTVRGDPSAPVVTKAVQNIDCDPTGRTVDIQFDESVSLASATDPNHYAASGGQKAVGVEVVDVPPPPKDQALIDARDTITDERIEGLIKTFSAFPTKARHKSRVPGYGGAEEARDFVCKKLEEYLGVKPTREDFVVPVPVEVGQSKITVLDTGEKLDMFCLWPNHVRTSSLPRKGISGHLIYAGNGEFKAFNGQQTEGSIVLMNFDSGENLMNARMLGAQAILLFNNAFGKEAEEFCTGGGKIAGLDTKALRSWLGGKESVTFAEAKDKFIHVPANIPRFWVGRDVAKKLLHLANKGKKIHLNARMDWKRVKATNIYAVLEGSDELMPTAPGEKPKKWKENLIVLEAYYDSMSVVPRIAPGAENACSIAALLELARVLKEHRPKYSVMFLATSAHFEGLSGIYRWLYRHSRSKSKFYAPRLAENEKIDFRLFLGLDISSHTDQIAAFSEGTFSNWGYRTDNYKKNALSPIAKKFLEYYVEVYPPIGDEVAKWKKRDLNYLETRNYLNAVTPSKRSWRHYMKTDLALDNEAVTWVGHFGVALATAHDRRKYVDTPHDTLDRMNIANVTKQTQVVASLLMKAGKDPEFFPDTKLKFKDYGHSMKGNVYLFDRNVNFFVPKAPVGNALVSYYLGRPTSRAGVRTLMVAMTQPKSPGGGDEYRGYKVENVTADGGRVRVKIWDREIARSGQGGKKQREQWKKDMAKVSEAKVVAATRYGTFEYPLNDRDQDGVFEAVINLNRVIHTWWSIFWAGVMAGVVLLLCGIVAYAVKEKPRQLKVLLNIVLVATLVVFAGWTAYVYIWHIAGDPRLPRKDAKGNVLERKDNPNQKWDVRYLTKLVLAGGDGKRYEPTKDMKKGIDVSYGKFKGQFLFDIRRHRWTIYTRIHELDDEGRIIKVTDQGQEGDKTYPQVIPFGWWETSLLGVVFPCRAMSVFETIDSRFLSALDYATLLGPDDSQLQWYCVDSIYGQSRDEGQTTNVAVVYAKPGTRVKILMSTSMVGVKYLLTNAPKKYFDSPPTKITKKIKKEALGLGYPINQGLIVRPAYDGTRDMWILDDVRMKELAKYSVRNDKLDFRPTDPKDPIYQALKQAEQYASEAKKEKNPEARAKLEKKAYETRQVAKADDRLGLHVRSKLSLDDAQYFLKRKKYEKFITATREGWGLEARGYPDVKSTANDTVKGIVFYFMLLLPFSFFGERLICGTPNVYKRIIVFSAIFFSVFVVLRYVHPAFKLSSSPYIIFLAFVIFALGLVVLFFVLSKFNQEVQKIKRASSGIHEVDVGRLSATLAAVLLGISNLRKRPLRTGLTAVTLILLTFTVLSFTSVKTGLHFYKLPRKNTPPYQGALIRDRSWKGLQPSVLKYLRSAFKPVAHVVAPRAWRLARTASEKEYIKLVNKANNKPTYPNAVIGLTPEETQVTGIDQYLIGEHSRWFRPGDREVCIMPSDMASIISISPEDITEDDADKPKVQMLGEEFTVIGIIDSERFNRAFDMDDEKLTPVDTVSEGQRMREEKRENPDLLAAEPIETFVHLESSNCILAPYDYVIDCDGSLRSVAITNFKNPKFVHDIEEFMRRVALTVFVGEGDRVVVYSSIGRTSLGGVSNLLIPILIAALIVMNTMMGSVYERFREIGIYSSVGLAPNHIAALFLAESAVFATIGAVMGYLLGQIVTLGLSHFGVLKGMNLNYSSLSAIWSTLVVMGTVFLSALYPAKKAADMAVPDVTRKWKFPEPKGDNWVFDFPFTVGGAEIVGMYAYLARVFESYGEGSTGGFVAEGVTLQQAPADSKGDFRITMKTWLAPYDLGISQNVTLDAIPTGEHNIYRVEVTLHRQSGDVASWRRINRGFLNVLRKRFLVWRTVDQGEKESYRDIGKEKLGLAPAPAGGE